MYIFKTVLVIKKWSEVLPKGVSRIILKKEYISRRAGEISVTPAMGCDGS